MGTQLATQRVPSLRPFPPSLPLFRHATIDDQLIAGANRFTYTSGWTNCGGCSNQAYNSGYEYAYATNEFVTLTFSGRQAKVYGWKEVYGGIASVSVDGGAAVDVEMISVAYLRDVECTCT